MVDWIAVGKTLRQRYSAQAELNTSVIFAALAAMSKRSHEAQKIFGVFTQVIMRKLNPTVDLSIAIGTLDEYAQNEIAGGICILCVSFAGWLRHSLGKVVIALGCATGLGGLATIVPALGNVAGAIFGFGATAWFIAVGFNLLGKSATHMRGVNHASTL